MYNSSLKMGVSQTYLDYLPSYIVYISYVTNWINTHCQLNVEQVIYESSNVAYDQLTITDKGVTVDIMMDLYTVNSKWFSRVGMFFPLETSSMFIFSKNPFKINKDSFQNFLPINKNVYLCLLSMLILGSFVLTLTKYRFRRFRDLTESNTKELANMAVVLVRQGKINRSKTLPYRVLFGSWLLAAFLLSTATQTYLNCEFANSQFVVMDEVSDVVDNLQRVEPFVFGNTSIEEYLKHSHEKSGPVLWQYLKEKNKFLNISEITDVIDKLSEAKHFAFFITKSGIYMMGTELLGLDKNDRVFEGRPLDIVSLAAIHGINVTSACKEQLNRKFIKVEESKLIEADRKEVGFALDNYLFRPSLDQQEFVLNFNEFKSTVVILFVGYSTATAFFAINMFRVFLQLIKT